METLDLISAFASMALMVIAIRRCMAAHRKMKAAEARYQEALDDFDRFVERWEIEK